MELTSTKKTLMITEHVGTMKVSNGTGEVEEIDLSTTLSREPIITFENGDRVSIGWEELYRLALEFREKENNKLK